MSEANEPDGLRLLAAWAMHQHALACACSDDNLEAKHSVRAYELVLYQINRVVRGEPPVYMGGCPPGKLVDSKEFDDIYEAACRAAKESTRKQLKEVQGGRSEDG